MARKFLFTIILVLTLSLTSWGAEPQQDLASDYVAQMQKEISADISSLRVAIDKELAGLKLNKNNIPVRIHELEALQATASKDMGSWGYTPEQREQHEKIISDLITAYSAYNVMMNIAPSNGETGQTDSDTSSKITSPDITMSDSLRKEITKVSRRLDVQIFYLLARLNKLKIELNEATGLGKQLKEFQEGNADLELPHSHALAIERAKLNLAITRLQVRSLKITFDKDSAEIYRLRRRLEGWQDKLIFPKELLDSTLEKLQARADELNEEMKAARKALDSANAALIRARVQLGSADVNIMTNTSASYLARSARVTYWEYMVALINDEIALNLETQAIWQARYKLFHDQASGDEIWTLRNDAQTRIQELQRQLEGVRSMENNLLRQIDLTQERAKTEGISGQIQQGIMQATENQRKIITDVFNRYEAMIPDYVFLEQRLYNEANDNLSALRLAEKVSSFSKETVLAFLNTELWQGEGYSVTVWKLTVAILVFLSSFFLSSWGSHWIKRRMINRFKASVTAANAVQRIVFYILWVAFALIALNIVKIPLTAFAFMGGAIAVGLGFGMQNIFNNLISGFIVIFSRPFKVNDIIDVAGMQGTVEDIGSRSTTIKTWDGFDVILPNRYFLENSVTNWTKSDVKKREILKISVSYEADSREIEKILMDVVKGHSKVLSDPAPFVIFKDFGADGLEFEIYYWIELRKSSGLKVSSDMRHHIAAIFKREGISIPFPQRDIHIIESKIDCNCDSENESA